MPATILQATDQVFCKHCGQWHPIAPDTVAPESPDRAGTHYRYTTCEKGHFYVGCIGTPCIHPTRQPPVWTMRKDSRVLECCLRSQGEHGWDVELYRSGKFYASQRFVLHAEGVAFGEQLRHELSTGEAYAVVGHL